MSRLTIGGPGKVLLDGQDLTGVVGAVHVSYIPGGMAQVVLDMPAVAADLDIEADVRQINVPLTLAWLKDAVESDEFAEHLDRAWEMLSMADLPSRALITALSTFIDAQP